MLIKYLCSGADIALSERDERLVLRYPHDRLCHAFIEEGGGVGAPMLARPEHPLKDLEALLLRSSDQGRIHLVSEVQIDRRRFPEDGVSIFHNRRQAMGV